MTKTYHYKKGPMQLGPYPLEKMQALARQGQVGRSHQISIDGGSTWDSGSSFPEIFQSPASEDDQRASRRAGQVQSPVAEPARPAEPLWSYCVAGVQADSPVPESELRHLIEIGRLGPQDTVWTAALGDSWATAGSIPKFAGLFRSSEAEANGSRDRSRSRKRRREDRGGREESASVGGGSEPKPFNGAGLAGFICSMVAIVLLAVPCLVWVAVAESFFWMFNIVIPFTILAIVGLVLSVIGLSRNPRGLATTGTVLGVIALMLGVMALVGWAMLPYRFRMQRQTQIDSFATDIKLNERTLTEHLAEYRDLKRDPAESDGQFQRRREVVRSIVGAHVQALVKAYDGHVSACAKTSEFQQAFVDLGKLRKTLDEIGQAAQSVEELSVVDVLEAGNVDTNAIRILMDTLKLYERGEITLKQAEAKMTGR
jgi:hypothetical protein